MSESESYEEVTVASNGITVIKTFEADAFPVPAIAFRIRSDRTEPVTVRLVDDVPENVAVEDLGFHPEYGSEHWTIEDDEITFERDIESEETYTTVYGIRATGTDDVEQFLTEPEIADVDPPLEDEDGVVGGSGSDVVRDVISGNTDSVPGLEDEDADEEDIGTLDLKDPNAVDQGGEEDDEQAEAEADDEEEDEADEAEAEDEDAHEETEADDTGGDGAMIDADSVVTALVNEIEEGTVDDGQLEVLREELGVNGDDSGGAAVDARIESLQSDVSDLEAYIDALEEFLNENGKGEDLIEDVQEQIDELEGKLSGFEDDIESNSDDVSSLSSDLDELDDDLSKIKADIKDFGDDIEEIEGSIDSLGNELDDVENVEDRVDDIDGEIEELKEWREQLSNVLGAADGD
jgi:predicted  nucleic acid-binding Zn-ribbon protein